MTQSEGKHPEVFQREAAMARFGELALRSDDLDEILTEACRLVGQALGTELAKAWSFSKTARPYW
jgi:GAF domain-containing protein